MRAEVRDFANHMENRLVMHDNEKGDDWKECSFWRLKLFLDLSLGKLFLCIFEKDRIKTAEQCGDVANFLMMMQCKLRQGFKFEGYPEN